MSGSIYLIQNPFSPDTFSYIVPKIANIDTLREFVFDHKGPLYAMGASEVMAYISSKYQDASVDWPDLQIFFASYSDVSDGGMFSRRGSGVTYEYYAEVFEKSIYKDAIMIIPLLMRPESRGRILLSSSDPYEYPIIHANYFDVPIDIDILVFSKKFCFNFSSNHITAYFILFFFFRLREQNLDMN